MTQMINEHFYPCYIYVMLRQYEGLDPTDTSRDDVYCSMSQAQVFKKFWSGTAFTKAGTR